MGLCVLIACKVAKDDRCDVDVNSTTLDTVMRFSHINVLAVANFIHKCGVAVDVHSWAVGTSNTEHPHIPHTMQSYSARVSAVASCSLHGTALFVDLAILCCIRCRWVQC